MFADPPQNSSSSDGAAPNLLPAPPPNPSPDLPDYFDYGCMSGLFDWYDAFFFADNYSQFMSYSSCSPFSSHMSYLFLLGGGMGGGGGGGRPQDNASNKQWRKVLSARLKGLPRPTVRQ